MLSKFWEVKKPTVSPRTRVSHEAISILPLAKLPYRRIGDHWLHLDRPIRSIIFLKASRERREESKTSSREARREAQNHTT